MYNIWILLFLTALTDAYQPALLIANGTGLFYHNITLGLTTTVIPFSYGVTYVDYKGETEIYAIVSSTKAESHKIIRVEFPKDAHQKDSCTYKSLPGWCYYDDKCVDFCRDSNFENISQVIMPKNCMFPSNLVLDWKNDNIYWSCQVSNRKPQFTINRATIEGKQEEALKPINGKILDMKTDPYANSLFWLKEDKLKRIVDVITANLDAAYDRVIYTFNVTEEKTTPNMILDIHNKKVYLVQDKDNLLRMDYDGTNQKQMDPTLLEELFNLQFQNATRTKLYHPLLQTPDLNCPEHDCTDVCELISVRGVECINNRDKSNIGTNTESPTMGRTSQPSISYTENTNSVEDPLHPSVNPTTESIKDIRNTLVKPPTMVEEVGVSNVTAAGVVSSSAASSSGRLAMFLLVFVTIWSSILLVGVVIKKKVYEGSYSPSSKDDSIQAST